MGIFLSFLDVEITKNSTALGFSESKPLDLHQQGVIYFLRMPVPDSFKTGPVLCGLVRFYHGGVSAFFTLLFTQGDEMVHIACEVIAQGLIQSPRLNRVRAYKT